MMHIFSIKDKTKKMRIELLPDAHFLHIPLTRYLDYSPKPTVNIGDQVEKYQLIGLAQEEFATNVHSPVSGKVVNIESLSMADGNSTTVIVIENDFKETTEKRPLLHSSTLTPDTILDIIKSDGIVGAGGAQFPTYVKYNLEGKKIHTLIINGTECEPYLTADYALMSDKTKELLQGIVLANKILNAENIVISIEKQNKDLINIFKPLLQEKDYKNFRIVTLPNEYPQGGELQLIKSITSIELSRNQRPHDAGVVVSNVGTIYAIYNAVINRKPFTSRIITISGDKSEVMGNYEVNIGTPISHILESLKISTLDKTIVMGGPMMGKAITNFSNPITKGSAGLLVLSDKVMKSSNCISCGYCVDVCPMHLTPMKFAENYRKGKYFKLEKYNISSCIECGACAYICPSNVPLMESIKDGKIKLKQLANAIQ